MIKDTFSDEGFALSDLQRALDQVMEEHNHRGMPQFEGYSPAEMFNILHHSLRNDSIVSLRISDATEKGV